ncbi:MAG: hypothetical protein GYA45_11760 [Pelolinea sp.]|nr:hypothetical protein [Pelolinea sp.]
MSSFFWLWCCPGAIFIVVLVWGLIILWICGFTDSPAAQIRDANAQEHEQQD